jgi:endonuclease-8
MPEGPEVRRAAEKVAAALVGRIAQEVFFAFESLKKHERRLAGRRVREVEAHGKATLVRFEGGLNVYSHNQLYGKWFVRRRGAGPRTRRSLRFAVHNTARSALLYSASDIAVLRDSELDRHPYLARLGPDVLSARTKVADVVSRLEDPRWIGRSLAGILMDQAFLAGLGNYLRSEVLFAAGVDPRARGRDLDAVQRRTLAEQILRLARRSYRTGGITNSPARARELRDAGWPRRRYRHWVFGRGGETCHDCGTRVTQVELGGRRLFWCRRCQRAGRRRG